MRTSITIPWASWATPGNGPEFRYIAQRPVRPTDLIRRLCGRRTDEYPHGGDAF